MQLRIDFSGRRSRPHPFSVVVLALAIGLSVAAVNEYVDAYGAQERLAQALAGARLQVGRGSITLSQKQIEAVNRIVRQLNLPWQSLLSAVEAQLSDRVALLSLDSEASSRTLRLQAEAKSADDMMDFVDALDGDERFVSALLTRHEVNESDRNRPYRFFVEAEWSDGL